jgi:hypothetical protein
MTGVYYRCTECAMIFEIREEAENHAKETSHKIDKKNEREVLRNDGRHAET